MLFNSIEFAFFLPIVFAAYWLIPSKYIKAQNCLLLIASYIFYGWWDWRFLCLILISSFVDYYIGHKIFLERTHLRRKTFLTISLFCNLGLLIIFKYYNFFVDNFVEAFTLLGTNIEASHLEIILPVGISFYTFQTLSYSIDVYRKELNPSKDVIAFLAFVSFFPQLVAGPIERARNLLPQFSKVRRFSIENATDGLRQILWGLFKKIVIADNCAIIVNDIFQNYPEYNGSTLLLGAFLFSFQIYCDFSGYSDIAIGTARLFNFDLKQNFAFPYLSRNIAEFWRRWHISLSSWFRDYLYIPLGGSKRGTYFSARNVFIIFLVSGFWHGASWTFIVWGTINASLFLPLMIFKKNRTFLDTVAKGKILPNLKEAFQIINTFLIVTLCWVFFRSASVEDALSYLSIVLSPTLMSPIEIIPKAILVLLAFFFLVEWFQREKQHALQLDSLKLSIAVKWSFYYTIITLIIIFGGVQQDFIYFQF